MVALLSECDINETDLLLQEELLFHIHQSEAKDLKSILRAMLQQQAGISASAKLSRTSKLS